MNFLDNLEPGWLWMIGGVLLLIAEVIAPGFFLVFVGVAAVAAGVFTLLFDLGVAAQLSLFAIYTLDPLLNDRAARLVGRSVTVIEAVDEHSGRVRVGDSEWSARGGPGSPGERVRIRGVEGNCLLVEPEPSLPPS